MERAEKIKVEYESIDGLTKTLSAEGLQSICIQHEMDHLAGKLFVDRLSPLKKQMAKKKLKKARDLMDALGTDAEEASPGIADYRDPK